MKRRRTPMWDGQRAFRSLAQADARELFDQLDERLEPSVLLVGILWDDVPELAEVSVEPANDDVRGHLAGVGDAAGDDASPAAPAAFVLNPRLVMAHAQQGVHLRLQRALQERLARFDETQGRVSFCSLPQQVGAYMVCTVVQFGRETFAGHGSAFGARAAATEGAFGSLVEATVDEFLTECSLALTRPDLGRYGVMAHEIPDLMRSAGKKLMYGPGSEMHGMTDLYDICNMISTMRYEGSDSAGGLLVAPRDRDGVHVALSLGRPVSLRDYRSVRKLLEITGEGLLLLCADGEVYGLGSVSDPGPAGARGFYRVTFSGHHAWRLELGERVLMEVGYGQPHLPKERIDATEFRRHVAHTFSQIDPAEIETLWRLVSEAAQQRHGTMVVVTSGAESEAVRLRKQGISIEPMALTPDLMRLVTAIDGAVLIDQHNVCHAIGTILDGRSSDAGDPSRGARFNSAVRYVESSEQPCLAIVVSEDGMIDLVSNG